MAPIALRPSIPGNRRMGGVLGLFPSFENVGGLEVSGRLAWAALADWARGDGAEAPSQSYLFCYGKRTRPTGVSDASRETHAHSKIGAVVAALSQPWPVELTLVWHLGLLKIVPLLRVPDAKVVLCLIGIEAWQPHGWLTRRLMRRVDHLVAISNHTWKRFVDANPQFADVPCRTILLGIGAPYDAEVPPPDLPAAVMLGRLSRSDAYSKGHREMIRSWPIVLRRRPDAELWIVGDGSLRGDLEAEVAALGLSKRVRFWGHVSERRKIELLTRATCLALPSRGEGFGLVYLEAMRLGRPCLVSTVDAGREVVNPPEAGLAADPDDPLALAEATCRLLDIGPEWSRWSAQARARYDRQFTARHFQHRLVSTLAGIAGSR